MKKITGEEYKAKYDDKTDGTGCLTETEAKDLRFPRRRPVSHKYSYGRALVVAGCLGYSGAPVLAANACERSGAGLTHLLVPESIYSVAAVRCDGAVVTPLPADKNGGLSPKALREILLVLKKANACLIGPGLGKGEGARNAVRAVLREAECPLVLDADALNLCADDPGMLSDCRVPLILTPHEGEFRRIGGDLTEGRLAGARKFAEEHPNVLLILKGFGTLICGGETVTVNPTGGPALSKGGTGDVLSGILCALLAQGFDPRFAAECAVYVHGLAGDRTAEEKGEYSLAPSDLICALPEVFRSLSEPGS